MSEKRSAFYCCLFVFVLIDTQATDISFNRPYICPLAAWKADGIVDLQAIGLPSHIFLNTNNTIFAIVDQQEQITIIEDKNNGPITSITIESLNPSALFVSPSGDVYVHTNTSDGQVQRWSIEDSNLTVVMNTTGTCFSIFIDRDDYLYCSLSDQHQVIRQLLNTNNDNRTDPILVAGNGTAGSTSNLLNTPRGIHVDEAFNLYVADCLNNRVQRFPMDSLDAVTMIGNDTDANLTLSCPTAVTLDKSGYLFVVDSGNHRIIGSNPNGYRCIVGCSIINGLALDLLNHPLSFSFDKTGKLFVLEQNSTQLKTFKINDELCSPAYNVPLVCLTAKWNSDATSIFNISEDVDATRRSFFINRANNLYILGALNNSILINSLQSIHPSSGIALNSTGQQNSLFLTNDGSIFYDTCISNSCQVVKLSTKMNTTLTEIALITNDSCTDLTIDNLGSIYCSMKNQHRVIRRFANMSYNETKTVAGNGTSGSEPHMLSSPLGIYVAKTLHLFVADCGNDRIQVFPPHQFDGSTLVGFGANNTIDLNCPSSITMDARGTLYITDRGNHRIVRGGKANFRCIAGCDQTNGSTARELAFPGMLQFDSMGNIYVTDTYNNRIQKFLLRTASCDVSYHQPSICTTATWNFNATTLVDSSILGDSPMVVFLDKTNTFHILANASNAIFSWFQGNISMVTNLSNGSHHSSLMFASNTGEFYIDSHFNSNNHSILKWTANTTSHALIMSTDEPCSGLFVDIYDDVYCSIANLHQVLRHSLDQTNDEITSVAGNGTSGAAPNTLSYPRGIFITTLIQLYVADCGNNRIQLFQPNNPNGTTINPNASSQMNCPSAIILDQNQNLFVLDSNNHRLLRLGSNFLQCIAGCNSTPGSAADQLNTPRSLSFDAIGNIYVADTGNGRIQQFIYQHSSCNPPGSTQSYQITTDCTDVTGPVQYTEVTSTHKPPLSDACEILQPCENNGTCINTMAISSGFICQCPLYFDGGLCEIDGRLCRPGTCWNAGKCIEISNSSFLCNCQSAWRGDYCEQKVDYCLNVTCLNGGVCRGLVGDYRCECLGDSYSGRHCEVTSIQIIIRGAVAKSFASVAITAIVTVVAFIIVMDVLKYGFKIDPVNQQRRRRRRRKNLRNKVVSGIHFIYLNETS